jgi:hypothetical protein
MFIAIGIYFFINKPTKNLHEGLDIDVRIGAAPTRPGHDFFQQKTTNQMHWRLIHVDSSIRHLHLVE